MSTLAGLRPNRSRYAGVARAIAAAMLAACGGDGLTPPNDSATAVGTIVFAYTPEESKEWLLDLYVARPDGTGLRLISALPGADVWPDLAPDGRRLVFTRKTSSEFGIWIENVDGTGLRQLPTQGQAAYARWSADGQWIVFDRRSVAGTGLALIRPDGSDMRMLSLPSPYVARYPESISVQGRVAFFMGTGAPWGTLWSSNLDGSGLVQLSDALYDGEPRWSPDGTKLVVSSLVVGATTEGWDIVVMNADGSGRLVLTPSGVNFSPTWSPDGKWILYGHSSDEVPGAEHCSLQRVPSTGGRPETVIIPMLSKGACGGLTWASARLESP